MSEFNAPCTGLGNGTFPLANSEGGPGFMTVLDATKNSVNNAFMDMATKLDLCKIFTGAEELGVHRADGADMRIVPSGVIGTNEVAPLTMAAAFAAFSADGVFCNPIAIEKVEDRDGKELAVPDAGCRQAISPDLAHAVTYGLSFVWDGTAKSVPRLPDGRPASGKTGTTSENEHTWFVGFTKQLSTAVWVGHPQGMIPMHSETINGSYRRYVYGSDIAAPAWRAFMVPASAGHARRGVRRAAVVDGQRRAGHRAAGRRDVAEPRRRQTLRAAGFHVKTTDETVYSSYPAGTVADTSPGGGSPHGARLGRSPSRSPRGPSPHRRRRRRRPRRRRTTTATAAGTTAGPDHPATPARWASPRPRGRSAPRPWPPAPGSPGPSSRRTCSPCAGSPCPCCRPGRSRCACCTCPTCT